jgi:hypothetical protein
VTDTTPTAPLDRRRLVWPIAAIAVAVAAALAAWGTFSGDGNDAGEYLVVLAVIGVAAVVVFGWFVPRSFRSGAFGLTGLILASAGLVSVVIFWSGLPPILGLAGAFLGWVGRERRRDNLATAALVVGVLALVADLLIYIQDLT